MEMMVPFYYAIAALLFGIIAGFIIRCYQMKGEKSFIFVLKRAGKEILQNLLMALLLPLLVVYSEVYRRILIYVLIENAEKDYTVKISEVDKESLVEVLMERVTRLNLLKIALSLTVFYYANLFTLANATIKQIVKREEYKISSYEIRGKYFENIPFYKSNILAQTLFGL